MCVYIYIYTHVCVFAEKFTIPGINRRTYASYQRDVHMAMLQVELCGRVIESCHEGCPPIYHIDRI